MQNKKSWYEKTVLFEECIEDACFLIMFFSVLIQIVFRNKFIASHVRYSPIWTEELARWLYVYIVFFGAGQAIHYREHIGIDIIVGVLPQKIRKILLFVVDILLSVSSAVITYFGILNMPFARRQSPITLPVNNGMLYIVIPIGFALMTIRSLVNAGIDLKHLQKKEQINSVAVER